VVSAAISITPSLVKTQLCWAARLLTCWCQDHVEGTTFGNNRVVGVGEWWLVGDGGVVAYVFGLDSYGLASGKFFNALCPTLVFLCLGSRPRA
jgi:hypothetical protein